ncbi:MAG TPA: serine hydrolase domain-containing protein [Armatimonadota bacterium]|jgi:CubicO group peptidase (beta-lactamase class C family)
MRLSLVCAGAFVFAGIALAAANCRADKVDDYVRAEMKGRHIPGVSIAVIRNDRIAKVAGYGFANLEQNTSVTPDTVFQIQSMTKSFTAAGLLMLVEDGRVSVNDPISRYLDGVPAAWKDITVRHLLTHTSGIKDYINEPTQSLRLDVDDEDVLKAAAARPLNFTPGDRYQYSNTNYLLVGMIIRKVTGKPYGDWLRERIFEPLGMTETSIYSWSEIVPHRSAGYKMEGIRWVNGDYIAPTVLGYPGGGILSTVRDLAKWDIALSKGHLLRTETRKEMWTPARLNDGTMSHYGYGWDIGSMAGHSYQDHNGSHSSGFGSTILRFPEDHLSVIVLCNLAGADTFSIARGIAARYIPDLAPLSRTP